MKYKQNLHTHTHYCDGADSPEEMILAAIEKGYTSVGFSGHSYMHYSPGHSMSLEGTQDYCRTIRMLADTYKEQIDVYCGLEYDYYSEIDLSGYDYLIGSVHYFLIDDAYIGFDRSQQEVQRVINTCFGGDGMKYARAYYEMLAKLPQRGHFDILGHADLITKHSENICFFDESSKEYQRYVIEALEALAGKIPYFEVNTGAIARGYRTTPYPSPFILKELKRLGFGAVLTSDCHDRNLLDCYYENAVQLLQNCGFSEQFILTRQGFVPDAL